jgi:hypothetical protein
MYIWHHLRLSFVLRSLFRSRVTFDSSGDSEPFLFPPKVINLRSTSLPLLSLTTMASSMFDPIESLADFLSAFGKRVTDVFLEIPDVLNMTSMILQMNIIENIPGTFASLQIFILCINIR